ncbi:hypothetical protein D9M69_462690 [compost metagenome]
MPWQGDGLEDLVIHQEHNNVRTTQSSININQRGISKTGRELVDIGLDHHDVTGMTLQQFSCNRQRRTFAQVIDIGLESKPKTGHRDITGCFARISGQIRT